MDVKVARRLTTLTAEAVAFEDDFPLPREIMPGMLRRPVAPVAEAGNRR